MLKDILNEKGMNINQLSERSGVGYSYVYKLANGKTEIENCGLGTAKKIADVLQISLDDLFERGRGAKNVKLYT